MVQPIPHGTTVEMEHETVYNDKKHPDDRPKKTCALKHLM